MDIGRNSSTHRRIDSLVSVPPASTTRHPPRRLNREPLDPRPREDPRVDRGVGRLERSGVVPRRDDQAAVGGPSHSELKGSGRKPIRELERIGWSGNGNGFGLGTGNGIGIGTGIGLGRAWPPKNGPRGGTAGTGRQGRGAGGGSAAARSTHGGRNKNRGQSAEQPGRSHRDGVFIVSSPSSIGRENS